MRFTAETSGVLEMQNFPSPYMNVRTYGRTGGRLRHNQNFLDAQRNKFSYPWCSAARASRARELRY